LSRTWVQGSTRVRGAVGSAWANLDQYRQGQRKPAAAQQEGQAEETKMGEMKAVETNGGATAAVEKKESFVGGWAAWAAEKRKKAFVREEPVKVERVDIGPAPARPLAMWAAKRKSGDIAGGESGTAGSVRSSSDTQVEGSVEKEMKTEAEMEK